jgi:Ca2+-transporting ATPase
VASLPFDSVRKMMSTFHSGNDGLEMLTKGAPEQVLEAASYVLTEGRPELLTSDNRSRVMNEVESLARSGAKVLALAVRPLDEVPAELSAAEQDLTLVGLAVLADPLRPEAATTVGRMSEAGVGLVMVTGDHAGTAAHVARLAGLTAGGEGVLTGRALREGGLPSDLDSVRVYARVDPEQKLEIVEAFQRSGQVVAVTGDGVNDAPALRRANIGVAMGRGGSQVALEAADLVITDDDLNLITKAVREGRAIFDNIRKVVDYLVAGNLSEITVVLAGLAFFPEIGIPLLPLQLLWINLLTDGLPALAFGFDRHRRDLLRRPTGAATSQLLSARRLTTLAARALVLAGGAIAALTIIRSMGGTWEEARSVMFTALVIAHLLYAFVVRLPPGIHKFNPRLAIAIGLGLALQSLGVLVEPVREVLGLVAIDRTAWLVAGSAGVASVAILAVITLVSARRNRSA